MLSITQPESTSAKWDSAVEQYNAAITANAKERLARMGEAEIARYRTLHNLPHASPDDILQDLVKTGSFRGASSKQKPAKPRIGNKYAWASVQAKSFGKPWLELFYECEGPQEVECFVSVFGLGRREKDFERKIWLLELNEGLWECFDASEAGLQMIALDQRWSASQAPMRQQLWPEVCALLEQDICYSLRYGEWEETFQLRLKAAKGIDPKVALAEMPVPTSSAVFNMHRFEAGFPYSWVISR